MENPLVEEITVPLKKLDSVIPNSTKVDFIKIDVEGGEFNVLKGAKNILTKDNPVIIFEFGLGASNFYGTTPNDIFDYFASINYKISLLDKWLKKEDSLSKEEFSVIYNKNKEYYFIAYS